MAFTLLLAVFFSFVGASRAFLSSTTLKFDDESLLGTRDHAIITKTGLLRCITEFLKDNRQYLKAEHGLHASEFLRRAVVGDDPEKIQNLIGAVISGMRLQNAITEIQNSNAEMNSKPFDKIASLHFNGEQFEQGMMRLVRLRSEIVISLLKGVKFEHGRRLAGQYLHTLQDFYSHSNWVELGNRAQIYEDLGRAGVAFSADVFAKPNEPTCVPCSLDKGCDNNLITTKITSGYLEEQDILKPVNASKCHHGSKLSSKLERKAMGGINKETKSSQWSPHYKLHDIAAELAVEATKQFFEDIRATVGDDIFAKFLNLEAVRTLALVIDVSGSMGGEISSVGKLSTDFVQEAENSSVNMAFLYILVPFSDPDVGPVTVTSDPDEVIKSAASLKASKGGDCPEKGMTGLYHALLNSVDDSTIHYFSDADAKDFPLAKTVLVLAQQKRIKINFILSGKCSFRRKRRSLTENHAADNTGDLHVHRRTKRSMLKKPLGTQSLYQSLAAATGGQVLRTKKSEVSVLVDIIGSRISNVQNRDLIEVTLLNIVSDTEEDVIDRQYRIHVDDTLQDFLIVLSAEGNPEIKVANPTDSQTLAVAVFSRFKSLQIAKVEGFTGGPVLIQVSCTGPYSLQVTAKSPLVLSYSISTMENWETGASKPLIGRPIKGQQLLLNMFFIQPEFVQGVTRLSLIHMNGTEMESFPVQRGHGISDNIFFVLFTPSVRNFRFQFTGKSRGGRLFQRVKPTEITLETIQLSFPNQLINRTRTIFAGGEARVFLQIRNTGYPQNFTFQATDDLGFVQRSEPSLLFIAENETADVSLLLRAPANTSYGSTSTVVAFTSSSPNDQSSSNYLVFYITVVAEQGDNFPPTCQPVNQTEGCDKYYGTPQCPNTTWVSHLLFHDVGQGLLRIATKKPSQGQLHVAPFLPGTSNQTVLATYRSTCCHVSASVVVVDQVGSSSVCELNAIPDEVNLTASSEVSKLTLSIGETSSIKLNITNLGTEGSFTFLTSRSKHFISYVSPLTATLKKDETVQREIFLTGEKETGSNTTILEVRALYQKKSAVNSTLLVQMNILVTERKKLVHNTWNVTAVMNEESLNIRYGDEAVVIKFTATNVGTSGFFVFQTSHSQVLSSQISPSSVYLNKSQTASIVLSLTAMENVNTREKVVMIAVPKQKRMHITLFSKTVLVTGREERTVPILKGLVPTREVNVRAGATVRVNFTAVNMGQDGYFKLKVSCPPPLACHVTPESVHLQRKERIMGYLTVQSPMSVASGRNIVQVTALVMSQKMEKPETVIFTLYVVVSNEVIETQISEEEKGMSMTTVIAIVTGCILLIALVLLAFFLYLRKRRSWNVPKAKIIRGKDEIKVKNPGKGKKEMV